MVFLVIASIFTMRWWSKAIISRRRLPIASSDPRSKVRLAS
jgi:hypothetical protein